MSTLTVEMEISADIAEALMQCYGSRDLALIARMAINAKAEQLGLLDALAGPAVQGRPIGPEDWPASNPLQDLLHPRAAPEA